MTSTGARENPLIVLIGTAGFDRNSFFFHKVDYAKKVRDNIINDPHYFSVIYSADDIADWTDPEVWKACNPNLDISVSSEYLERQGKRAKEQPSEQNLFRMMHLNQWVESSAAWLGTQHIQQCQGVINYDSLKGRTCYAGIDLSTVSDLSVACLCFPPLSQEERYTIITKAFCPEEGITRRSTKDRVPYKVWRDEGHLIATTGNVVDYDFIIAEILKLAEVYQIDTIAIDRWNSSHVSTKLTENGFEVLGFGQGFASMASACRFAERQMISGNIVYDSPLLKWCLSNAVVEQDAAGNCKLSKKKSTERIDAAVALVMALELAGNQSKRESIYESREMIVL